MAGKALAERQRGRAVGDFQLALNHRAESRFYPPVVVDSDFGPATSRAFEALGWALGLGQATLKQHEIPPGVLAVFEDPSTRTAGQLERARLRASKLHERTIGLDGAPIFWGLAKPLVRARERGWGGRLNAGDRRAGIPERFGKKSQKALFECFRHRRETGRCASECGGDCNPANAPGQSSHELRSDGSAGFGGRAAGVKLPWWELGLDVEDPSGLLAHLATLGYKAHSTYPGSKQEAQHINFTASPGRVLPGVGPNAKPARRPLVAAAPRKATGRLRGIDVSLNQPSINWPSVAASGRAFAYAKVSDGLRTPDPKFDKRRWENMKAAGLARGAYHFARPQPGRDPRDEVHEFLGLLKRAGGLHDGDLVPMLDVEAYGLSGKIAPRATLEWLRGFVTEMHAQIGRRPVIYTGSFWRDQMGNPADNLGCKLWLAAYVKTPDSFLPAAWTGHGWTIWQHSAKGTVPGVEHADCDLNVLKGGTRALEKLRM